MYLDLIPRIVELGGMAVIAILAISCLFWIIKNRKNINGNNGEIDEIKELLTSIKGNHLRTIDTKIDFLTEKTSKNIDKLDQIIRILIEIKGEINQKLKKK